MEEHEEVVLEPRNTMGVHHRIYFPPLVHGHHGGCGGRASRGGPIARHRAEPHHHRLWLGVGRWYGGRGQRRRRGGLGERRMEARAVKRWLQSTRCGRGERLGELRAVSGWGRRLRAAPAHDDFSATGGATVSGRESFGRERTSEESWLVGWIGSGSVVQDRTAKIVDRKNGRSRSLDGRTAGYPWSLNK